MDDSVTKSKIAAGEKVVLGYCAANAVLGGIPFVTGPLLMVSDYTLFIAVKRVMDAPFEFKDVFSLVAPTIKGIFAYGLFKAAADAYGWSWVATIPVGAVVSAATTYALGMYFVHFNARGGDMSAADALGILKDAAFEYLDKSKAGPKTIEMARKALERMFRSR